MATNLHHLPLPSSGNMKNNFSRFELIKSKISGGGGGILFSYAIISPMFLYWIGYTNRNMVGAKVQHCSRSPAWLSIDP